MTNKQNLPHSDEAEKTLIGAMLFSDESREAALRTLAPEDFYRPVHQRIYGAISALVQEGTVPDMVAITEHMEQTEGGTGNVFEYLSGLAESWLPGSSVQNAIDAVRSKARLRQLMHIGTEICRGCQAGDAEAESIITSASDALYQMAARDASGRVMSLQDALLDAYAQISAALDSSDGVTGLHTGFPSMDTLLTGLHGGELIVIAGRPGMGKTSFAMNVAQHTAIRDQAGVLVFSMEMAASQLATRLLCSEASVDMQKARQGRLNGDDFAALAGALKRLAKVSLFIDDSPAPTTAEMTATARSVARTSGLAMVVIDYLQLMGGSLQGRNDNRVQEISRITRALKCMAKDLNVPILLLSQLSRAGETDIGRSPKLTDLRESGSIEQDADVVIFLQRDDYLPDQQTDDNIGRARLIIAKQRNGPTGTVEVQWDGAHTRYLEIDKAHTYVPSSSFSK